VISIIALLLAVLLPAAARVRKQARAVACQAKLRQWGLVFSMYVDDSDKRHPLVQLPKPRDWYRLVRPYCSDSNDMLLCPMATRYRTNPNDSDAPLNERLNGFCMGSKYTAWRRAFTIQNGQAVGGNFLGSYGIKSSWLGVKEYPAPTPPPQMPLLLDCVTDGVSPGARDAPPAFDGDLDPGSAMRWVCIDRHQGAIKGLFWDTTVRRVGLKELWTLKWHPHYDTANRWTKAGGVQPEDWPPWMRRFKDY